MGSPIAPNETQYKRLVDASSLVPMEPPSTLTTSGGATTLRFALPRQGVSLLVLEWGASVP